MSFFPRSILLATDGSEEARLATQAAGASRSPSASSASSAPKLKSRSAFTIVAVNIACSRRTSQTTLS
jgi:hypothetical protein